MGKRNRNTTSNANNSKASEGLASVVIPAILGSATLIIVAIIGYFGTQTQVFVPINATQTAEAKLSSVPTSTTTQSSTITSTLPPITPAFTATLTSTIEPSSTNVPTETPSPKPTVAPTSTIEPMVFRGLDKNCINNKYWYPKPVYSSDKITLDLNNCWNLSLWGILTENQTVKFRIQDDKFNIPMTRSIYTRISAKVTTIQFKVKVDVLTSASKMDGSVFIGLGNEGNYTKPGVFIHLVAPSGQNRVYLETGPDYMKYWEPRIDYTVGDILTVKIVIADSNVSVRVNGNVIRDLNLEATNKQVLWIGYTTPPTDNNITADIFDLSIYEK